MTHRRCLMCGIFGYIGHQSAVPILLDGLRRLEYRGYDSAGIAVIDREGRLQVRRAQGKLHRLQEVIRAHPLDGRCGLGHTRWATHGRPSEENAHPHRDCSGCTVVVHNGIIENYLALKRRLEAEGHRFASETDTEAIAHLVEVYRADGRDLIEAVRCAVEQLQGVFAFAVIDSRSPDEIVAARQGPPLLVGWGEGEFWIASDIPALLPFTRRVSFLADGDLVRLTRRGIRLVDFHGREKSPEIRMIAWDPVQAEKGGFRHFMLKEIHEQPRAIRDTVKAYTSVESGLIYFDCDDLLHRPIQGITIVGCGTSYHAGLVGRIVIEAATGLPVTVEYASEFRYRHPLVDERHLVLAITQSGETADTLAAVREARQRKAPVLSITNVVGSTITRESDGVIYTHAGPEIGVASTKTFTTQLILLFLMAVKLGQLRQRLSPEQARSLIEHLHALPVRLEKLLEREEDIAALARSMSSVHHALYLGRGLNYPVALEGALKLKELSYIHAEGYPAGEIKHGPIALVDEGLPVVVVNAFDRSDADGRILYEKTLSNMVEVKARGGRLLALVVETDDTAVKDCGEDVGAPLIRVPPTHPWLLPVVAIVPLQLLAYHVAVLRGCDVDQPRNLAKSVTVE